MLKKSLNNPLILTANSDINDPKVYKEIKSYLDYIAKDVIDTQQDFSDESWVTMASGNGIEKDTNPSTYGINIAHRVRALEVKKAFTFKKEMIRGKKKKFDVAGSDFDGIRALVREAASYHAERGSPLTKELQSLAGSMSDSGDYEATEEAFREAYRTGNFQGRITKKRSYDVVKDAVSS